MGLILHSLTAGLGVAAFRVWLGSETTFWAISWPIQCCTSATEHPTLHRHAFRGEPAISRFDWHFTTIHSSSHAIASATGSDLRPGTRRDFILAIDRSPGFGSTACDLRPIQTRFRYGSGRSPPLTLPQTVTRRFMLQKARRHTVRIAHRATTVCRHTVSGSISLPFRGSFHLSLTVLMRYRSPGVFSLTPWSGQIHTGFLVPRATWVADPGRPDVFAYRAITFYGASFQTSSTNAEFFDFPIFRSGPLPLPAQQP